MALIKIVQVGSQRGFKLALMMASNSFMTKTSDTIVFMFTLYCQGEGGKRKCLA